MQCFVSGNKAFRPPIQTTLRIAAEIVVRFSNHLPLGVALLWTLFSWDHNMKYIANFPWWVSRAFALCFSLMAAPAYKSHWNACGLLCAIIFFQLIGPSICSARCHPRYSVVKYLLGRARVNNGSSLARVRTRFSTHCFVRSSWLLT